MLITPRKMRYLGLDLASEIALRARADTQFRAPPFFRAGMYPSRYPAETQSRRPLFSLFAHVYTRAHTYIRTYAIRHACTHRQAYGRCIIIRRDDCTSWCSQRLQQVRVTETRLPAVSTTVKARMCTGCNSIYLRTRTRTRHTRTYTRGARARMCVQLCFLRSRGCSFSRVSPGEVAPARSDGTLGKLP